MASELLTCPVRDCPVPDADKESKNASKHGVSFEEAALVMRDPLAIDFDDLIEPENIVTLAASSTGAILYILSTDRQDRIRIISARNASSHERKIYQEGD